MDVATIIGNIDTFVWGLPLIVMLLGTHLFMTVRTGFIQRKLFTGIRLSVTKDPDAPGDVSQFGALATALAATIGTGNIVGVATALVAGGPGALLWMWLTGVFGIATKYSETLIAVKFRVRDHKGNMLGGAMYALERGFKNKPLGKFLAICFALFGTIASFGIGSAVQANALTSVVVTAIPSAPWWLTWVIAGVVAFLSGIVIIGGVQSITKVTEKLVPFMAFFYVAGCLIILCINSQYLGQAFSVILTDAFVPRAAIGGFAGYGIQMAMQYGCARGLFSNESGLGSAPIVASAATTRNPVRQALVSMTGTFWDTVVICAMTALVLVTTMCADPSLGADIVAGNIAKGATLTNQAFALIPYNIGTVVLIVGMVTFTYSTILGWSYYGNRCVAYLLGKHAILPYEILYIAVAFVGAVGIGDLVWNISDITNALMAVPNVIAVLALSGLIWKDTKHYVYDGNLDEFDTADIPIVATK